MEPIERSETSASNTQTPGNYPKETVLQELSITFTILFKAQTILFIPENNEIPKRRSVSVGPMCK
jgi:hypothetical protein